MGTKIQGAWPVDAEPSWTDDTLPLEVRRGLLDRALDQIKARKARAHGHPENQDRPDHPGEAGAQSPDHNDHQQPKEAHG